jgi:hypothetical protein
MLRESSFFRFLSAGFSGKIPNVFGQNSGPELERAKGKKHLPPKERGSITAKHNFEETETIQPAE